MASSVRCVLALLIVVLSCFGGATAQIVILQKSGIRPSRRFCTDTSRGAQSSGTADAVRRLLGAMLGEQPRNLFYPRRAIRNRSRF